MQGTQEALLGIPTVAITPQGIFKYILIQATIEHQGKTIQANFVRGHKHLQYHADNFAEFIAEVKSKGFDIKKKNAEAGRFEAIRGDIKVKFQCPGGGRIQHNYGDHKCHIYGYSKSYGRVEHTIAQKLISESLQYPLQTVTTSQEGY